MKPISFVARDGTGNVDRGSVEASKNITTIEAEAGADYSFNLRQSDVSSYKRLGGNLEITLADGRIILIEDFFNASGQPVADLFLSADTYISQVSLVEGANGELYGQYGVAEAWGKYGDTDELIFVDGTEVAHAGMADDDVSMLGAGILSGLGGALGTAGAVAGGVGLIGGIAGGGGGGSTYVEPTVNDGTVVIGGDDVTSEQETVSVTGTADPGSEVVVVIGGETVTVVSDENGQWEAVFDGENFPDDGVYTAQVTVTEEGGTVTELTGPDITIDLTGPEIVMVDGVESTGDLVNFADHSDGVELSGTGEAGASISVTVSGVTHETVVGEDGSWNVTFSNTEIVGGEYETDVTIISTDSFGNSTTTVETLVVDTIGDVTLTGANGGADGVVNEAEHAQGVTLTGTAQAGSTVMVTLDGVEMPATVDASGNWSVTYASSQVQTGEWTGNVTVNASDANGNTSSATGTVEFDTLVSDYVINTTTGGADGVVNATEAQSGVAFGGTVEPGSTVMVNFGGIDRAATVDASGNWTVNFSAGEVPQSDGGTVMMTAVATDGAQNSSTLTQEVVIDNVAGSLTLSTLPIEGDNIVNAQEASDGVTVRGTSDAGNMVDVQLGNATVTVETNASGNWTANFSASQIEEGTYNAEITATTMDAAGNVRTVTGNVDVDTEVLNLGISTDLVAGDDVVNAVERDGGVEFSGTTEPGSQSVMVTIDGETRSASVDAGGNWSVTYPSYALPEGEATHTLEVDVTDRAGNTASTTRSVEFDTLVNELSGGAVEEGGTAVFNASDVADGVSVTGSVEAGSTVVVSFGGSDYTATVDASGNWTADLPAEAFSAESYSADLVITAKDLAGNVLSETQTIEIDADIPDSPEINGVFDVNVAGVDGYSAVQVVSSDDTQTVYEVSGSSATEVAADSDGVPLGGDSLYGLDPMVQDGSHLVVSAEDAAGNVSSTFVALDDPAGSNTLDMSSVNPGLAGLEIEAIDLTYAEDTNLTLSLDQIEAFADNSDTLAIHGGNDDTVTIDGAVKSDTSVSEGTDTYDVYTVGDTQVLIDDDITVI
ncbi:RTX toxin [Lentibacter algarum]|uniref:Ig-like domain-containing protein n=1 Tax=Lentibacter algarum TaxID=576131 RepID=UPI001C097DA8|nr:Ig-like domain-containing protein [Lentibacter algarum]MBU2983231.1 RTX toxin [Lentibacter algarum]